LPRVDAIAAKDTAGKLWLAITNLDPNSWRGRGGHSRWHHGEIGGGETLIAPKVDSIHTFDASSTVVPKPVAARVQGGKLALKLEPRSVTVISLEQ